VDYARHGKVERLLEEPGARVVSARFTDTVELVVAVPREAAEALEERLADATAGAAAVARAGERYLPAAGDGSKAAGRERSGGQPQL